MPKNDFMKAIDNFRSGPGEREIIDSYKATFKRNMAKQRFFTVRVEQVVRARDYSSKYNHTIKVGSIMERVAEEFQVLTEELEKARNNLEMLYGQVSVMSENLSPILIKGAAMVRHSGMQVSIEVNNALASMKEIRKFFLEPDYEKEVKRLAEFVTLCERLQKLKEAGTLDALCDMTMKKLAPEK